MQGMHGFFLSAVAFYNTALSFIDFAKINLARKFPGISQHKSIC